ncbi:MAG: 2-C-methyl-D-erythritol 4-phosphate cytidylyltransferase [Fimbriimonadaceae bacterium]|nr:2-C-methyl-D-erythritol 4-phosphate cytidylyltransferase [Fimbriimonadaceae bacterium]
MTVYAAILAAGRGTRFGADKTMLNLGGKPVWRWSFDTFCAHPDLHGVGIVSAPENVESLHSAAPDAAFVVPGGETRQASAQAALTAVSGKADILLLHDAARPFVTYEVISRVIEAVKVSGSSAPAILVTDTIKQANGDSWQTLDRSMLRAMQTPQGAKVDLLTRAHQEATTEFTDDLAMLEAIGVSPVLVEGDARNFKITTPDDWAHAQALAGPRETRTGIGYDIHPFTQDVEKELWLGGVLFPNHRALEGHSDADAIIHAAVDALLGAAALGDIGQHFPNSDVRWRGEPSKTFLAYAAKLLLDKGWTVIHMDIAVIAETPKIGPRVSEMCSALAEAMGVERDRVSIKATTNERLGSLGRGEGIAAHAVATISR